MSVHSSFLCNDESILLATTDNVKNISLLLKAINFKESAVFIASDFGMKIIVEDSKCIQANAFVGKELFQEDVITFRIDLNTLVECLTIFDGCLANGVTTAMKITYNGYGNPLKILLEEEGIITDCSLRTMRDCDTMEFDVDDESAVSKIILRAADVKDVFLDLDGSSDYVEFSVSPDPPLFKIATNGIAGACQVEIPKSSEVVEFYECKEQSCYRYKYNQLKPSLKSMAIANKLSIRTNVDGLICLQFMVQTESKKFAYIEYFCMAMVDDDMDTQ